MGFNFKGIKDRKATQYIIVHCSATTEKQNIGAADIDRWHRLKGWMGIGYHYVIKRDGTIEEGRPRTSIGAHCEGFNSISLGICLVGGVNADDLDEAKNNFTPAQFDALSKLLKELGKVYPTAAIRGHRDMPNVHKACPSFDVREWLKSSLR